MEEKKKRGRPSKKVENNNENIEKQNNNMEFENKDQKDVAEVYLEELELLKLKLSQFVTENTRLKSELEIATNKIQDLTEMNENVDKEFSDADNIQIQQLQYTLEQKVTELDNVTAELEAKNNDVITFSRGLLHLKNELLKNRQYSDVKIEYILKFITDNFNI